MKVIDIVLRVAYAALGFTICFFLFMKGYL
jgi:hypothetical protein